MPLFLLSLLNALILTVLSRLLRPDLLLATCSVVVPAGILYSTVLTHHHHRAPPPLPPTARVGTSPPPGQPMPQPEECREDRPRGKRAGKAAARRLAARAESRSAEHAVHVEARLRFPAIAGHHDKMQAHRAAFVERMQTDAPPELATTAPDAWYTLADAAELAVRAKIACDQPELALPMRPGVGPTPDESYKQATAALAFFRAMADKMDGDDSDDWEDHPWFSEARIIDDDGDGEGYMVVDGTPYVFGEDGVYVEAPFTDTCLPSAR